MGKGISDRRKKGLHHGAFIVFKKYAVFIWRTNFLHFIK